MLFTQALSHVPVTLPSHATILTGLLPPNHGVRSNGAYSLPAEVTTVVEQMQAVDTRGIEPLAHPIEQIEDVALRLREDAVTEIVQRDEFQRPAPAVQEGLYLVPKVIE